MFTSLWNFLTAPPTPGVALSITPNYLALVELQKRGGSLNPKRVALQNMPSGIVRASLTEPNIINEAAFIEQLNAAADQANFGRKLSLSVSLPEGSARSLVVALDQKPNSREELTQMLEWKLGRVANLNAQETRFSFHQLSPENNQPRWLVAAVNEIVLTQFERIFADLGWQAGLILPQHLGEMQWLGRGQVNGGADQVLVSTHPEGFVVVIVRDDEPLLIREVTCTKAEQEDELFRLMIFYRDRLASAQPLARMLIIAEPIEQAALAKTVAAALEQQPEKLSVLQLGLNLETTAPFHRLAAAAGLASSAF